MTNENNFDVEGMHIEIFLSSEEIAKNAIIIPKLPHGSNIVTIKSGSEDLSDCDALITQNRNLFLGIKTADCAPICFSDGTKIGIAHIGWRGLCLGFIEKMIAEFETKKPSVYVAPFLHSFEIKRDFCHEQLNPKFGGYIEQQSDKLVFNFRDAIHSLVPQAVFDPRSTGTDSSLPSYRRDKKSGRLTTVISFST